MLPVSAWPPGPPGASLSPFGKPQTVNVSCHRHGYVIPKGAWVVSTTSNQVMMFFPSWKRDLYHQPTKQMGTGFLPGAPPNPGPTRPTHDQCLERMRAWERKTGRNFSPVLPNPGRNPPNWDGWAYVPAPGRTLVQGNSAGLVIADGQNVVITGGGCATITEAFSV